MSLNKISYILQSVVLTVVILSVISCTSQTDPAEGVINSQILKLGNGTEPQDLDPHVVTGSPENRLMMALFEGLVARDPETLEIIPALAESWEISDDHLRYTFTLRPEAKWSNGDSLTAMDLYFSWRRMLDPAIASENAYNFYAMVNAEAYNKGEIEDFEQVGITVNGRQLSFTLREPSPLFIEWLSKPTAFPVHPQTIQAHGDISDRGTAWTRPGNMVSNGPFMLEEWSPNKIIRVVKNPHYWDKDKVRLDGVHFLPIESLVTEERMFRDGQIDMTGSTGIPTEKIAWYQQNQPDHIEISPVYATYYYLLNTSIKPLNDVRVRRALAMSIDRALIVDRVTKGGQIPAYTINPATPTGYKPESSLRFDIEAARQLLADAGYPDGRGFPELEILYNTLESHRQVALVIQQMWKQNLNIDTRLLNQEWKVFLDTQNQLAYQISRSGGGAEVADPSDLLNSYTSNSGMNHTGWSHPEYDTLIAQGKSMINTGERYGVFQQAERILMDEVPVIPIYFYTKVALKHPRVRNWQNNLLDYTSFKNVYLADE